MRIGKLIINALALVAAGFLPQVHLLNVRLEKPITIVYLLLLAVLFAVINTFIKPIARLASLPLTLFTLGLFGFVLNAAMLLLRAFAVGQVQNDPYVLRLGTFPPDFNLDTLIGAFLGGIVISVVSTVLALFFPDR